MPVSNTWTCCFALALAAVTSASAGSDDRDFHAVVSHVFDGDSFIVRAKRAPTDEIEVRLMGIDAPERGQPYADSARAALIDLIGGRAVFVDVVEIDQYGRKVAHVHRNADRLDIARVLIELGHVWVNRRFVDDPALLAAEDRARAERVGLWSLPTHQRVPPWVFRRTQRARNGRDDLN